MEGFKAKEYKIFELFDKQWAIVTCRVHGALQQLYRQLGKPRKYLGAMRDIAAPSLRSMSIRPATPVSF